LADTAEVLARIDRRTTKSKLLVIVANERGADEAVKQESVSYLGYPFSISETFQQRNTNTSIEGSWARTRGSRSWRANGKGVGGVHQHGLRQSVRRCVERGGGTALGGPSGERAGRAHHRA
jgi:hypothetical protein